MKKTIIFIALSALVIWGVYDISKTDSKSFNNPQREQSDIADAKIGQAIGLEQGNEAPNFTLSAFEGEALTLADYRGKKVLINMWASWCPPCKAEMPDMQQFYQKHQADGIEVLSINLTEAENNKEDVSAFISDYEITFPVALDEKSQVADQYQVTTIPTTYIVDSAGNIERKIVGPMTYEMMEEIMSQVN